MKTLFSCCITSLLQLIVTLFSLSAPAWGFSAYVSPARHELNAKPGQVIANIIDIGNDDIRPANYRLYSADWSIDASGGAQFSDADPLPTSCRPWLRLERRQLKLSARGSRKVRFEVHVPADAKPTLCRFAVMIEDDAPASADVKFSNIELPVAGRIGVIVYVAVGDIRPQLDIVQITGDIYQSRPTPVILVRNSGTAHGRLEGTLEGRDDAGRVIDFSVATLPILPGETRRIPIWPNDDANGKSVETPFPLTLSGRIEWQGGKREINQRIDAPVIPPPATKTNTKRSATASTTPSTPPSTKK